MEHLLGAKRLEDKVASILARVEKELDVAETTIGDRLRVLDTDRDGVVSERAVAEGGRAGAGGGCEEVLLSGGGGGGLPLCTALLLRRTLCAPSQPPYHPTPHTRARCCSCCSRPQISAAELSSAMSFLREQMGEEELRQMLHMLSEEAGAVYV